MKRIGVLVCLMMMVISVLAPATFAASNDAGAAASETGFEIVSSTPKTELQVFRWKISV